MKEKNDINSEEINKVLCPLCFSKLLFKYINQTKKIFLCSNNRCLFPMDHIDMDKFIFNIKEDNLIDFISNIKKIVIDKSFSNDTNFEEKIKKINQEDLKIDAKNIDYSDIILNNERHHFFDSFSENEFE